VIALALPAIALLGVAVVCRALGLSRATWYRHRAPTLAGIPAPPQTPPPRSWRRLSNEEEGRILAALHEARFADKAPAEVYATLLDEKVYLGSIRTFYRVLHRHQEVRERRALTMRPNYQRPELLATRPNELWSWDITKLRGASKWTYYYLYVIIDVFSRYVVAWMIAPRESDELAREFIAETCRRQGITPGTLTLHADRGSSMTSRSVAQMLCDLEVAKTHSRPHVSNDNPYSEAHFKTLKYRPDFPDRFGSQEDARAFCGPFFHWYNHEHHHVGIALLTPADVHHGRAHERVAARDVVLAAAYAEHPERFVKGVPKAKRPPTAAWINSPKKSSAGPQDGPPSCGSKEPGGCGGTTPAQGEVLH
jgi:putative transposase